MEDVAWKVTSFSQGNKQNGSVQKSLKKRTLEFSYCERSTFIRELHTMVDKSWGHTMMGITTRCIVVTQDFVDDIFNIITIRKSWVLWNIKV